MCSCPCCATQQGSFFLSKELRNIGVDNEHKSNKSNESNEFLF